MRFREYAIACRQGKKERGEKPCPSCEKMKCRAWWVDTGRAMHMGEALIKPIFTSVSPSMERKLRVRLSGKESRADFLRRLVYQELEGTSQRQQLSIAVNKTLEYLERRKSDLDINDIDRTEAIASLKAAKRTLEGAKAG